MEFSWVLVFPKKNKKTKRDNIAVSYFVARKHRVLVRCTLNLSPKLEQSRFSEELNDLRLNLPNCSILWPDSLCGRH